MAISKTITLENGLVAQNAYIRIDTVAGYKGHIDAVAYGYLSREAFTGEEPYTKPQSYVLGPFNFSFAPNLSDTAPGIFKQAYDALKLLPEFSEAVDC